MQITNKLLTPGTAHGRTGTALTPKGVVLHYVGNPGSTAENNRSWFENGAGGAYTSAHYIVGLQGEILRLIPETERAQHAGKSYGTQWDTQAKTNNGTYIGIECCHPDASGQFNDRTYAALVELVADICKRHGFDPRRDVKRHYDVCGKACPLYYKNNPAAWTRLVEDIVAGTPSVQPIDPTPTLRKGDKGQAVADMQALLNGALLGSGTVPLTVDGSFGPATETAIKAFQAANGLAVDGFCGPRTWAALLAYKEPIITVGIPLIGPPTATVEQAEAWARAAGATEAFIRLAALYWLYAAEQGGINPVIAYVQASQETGYGKCDGVVPESYHNPCGLKTKNGTSDTDPTHHQHLASWDDGVKAHLDHLALYAGAAGYPRIETLDPRHFAFLLGTGQTVETMAAGWCPGNKEYANIVKARMIRLESTAISDRPAYEQTVNNMLADGVITDPVHWLGYLSGTSTTKPEYVMTLLDRYHALVAKI